MNLNIDPNLRHRRKSTLGRRNRNNDQFLPRSLYPAIQVNGLPWSRSGKKKQLHLEKASKEYMTKKRLFLRSPSSEEFSLNSIQGEKKGSFQSEIEDSSERKLTSFITQKNVQSSGDSLLNITGIQSIKTPSPQADSLRSKTQFLEDYTCAVQYKSATNFSKQLLFSEPKHSESLCHNYPLKKISTVSFGLDELEPPKSPGPSLYNKLVLEEFADLKPPVDPDDNVNMSSNYPRTSIVPEQANTKFSFDPISLDENVSMSNNYPKTDIVSEPAYQKLSLDLMNTNDNVCTNQSHSLTKTNINLDVDTKLPLTDIKCPVNLSNCKNQLQNVDIRESRTCSKAISLNNYVNPKEKSSSCCPHESGKQEKETTKEQQHSSPNTADLINTVQSKEIVLNLSFIDDESQNLNVIKENMSIVDEDLDTTDMFLLTEQTLLEQDQTLTNQINTTENCISSNPCLEPLLEVTDRSETDEELDEALKKIDQGLEDMDRMRKEMNNLKTLVQRIIIKRQHTKIGKKEENKENVPVPVSTSKKLKNEWINNLKSGNPSLLKTPNFAKLKKPRTSLLDHSTTWTPRSLSFVLHEQVEDLFE